MTLQRIITLTTDFGTCDTYAGTIKGVILSINPQCTIVDITHQVAPQDIMGGCFALSSSYGYFPDGSIHLAVVDPGVGSTRRPILIETDNFFFVGPDNGIFSFILTGPDVKNIFEITNSAFFLPSVCGTFHGRDIFAPVAAHLSKGTPAESFGRPATNCTILDLPKPAAAGLKQAEGEIIHIDRFGNLITNFSRRFVEDTIGKGPFHAAIKGVSAVKLLPNYAGADEDELFCVFGSSNLLELSVKNKSARQMLSAQKGDTVRIKFS